MDSDALGVRGRLRGPRTRELAFSLVSFRSIDAARMDWIGENFVPQTVASRVLWSRISDL